MNIQAYNYMASVSFAVLAIALLFVCGYLAHSDFVMKAALVVSMLAWFACYAGTIDTPLGYGISAGLTFTACGLYVIAFFIVLM